ncbi:hypothetical protein GF340_02870 [Candidatus Peregrinibacteria bacterium]|nr:hypothetical protein [Candidatus Peregrinibacteria bacterium]
MKDKVGNWVVRKSGESHLIWDDEMEQAVAFLVNGDQLVDDDTRAQNALAIISAKIGVQLSLDELRADIEEEGRNTGFFPATVSSSEPPASRSKPQQAAPGPGTTEPGPQPPPLPTEGMPEVPEPPPDPQPPPNEDPPDEERRGISGLGILAAFAVVLACLGLCFAGSYFGPELVASLGSPPQVNETEIEMPVIPVSTATEDGLASGKRAAPVTPAVTKAGLPGKMDCQVGRFSVRSCDLPRGCSLQYLPDTAPRRLLVTCEGGHQYISERQMGEGKPWDADAFRAGARRLQFVTYN